MARFTETVDIRPGVTGQFDVSPLTDRLDAFAAQKVQQHQQEVAGQSFAQGRAAFEEGEKPEFKTERFFGGIGSKAYNEGLRASYVASIDRDNREEIAKITAENPDNLSKFNDTVESYRASTLRNVDPSARQVISDSMDSLISSNRIKVQNNEINKTHAENDLETSLHVERAREDALGLARDGNDIGAAESALAAFAGIDARAQAGFINASQAAAGKREIEKDLTEQKLKGGLFRTFDEKGPQSAFDELDNLSDRIPKGFQPEEWDSFITGSQADLNRKLARQERKLKGRAKELKKEQDFAAIEQRIDGDDAQIINPKAADTYYRERIVPQIENLPTEQRQAVQAQYMDRLKVIPNTMKQQITNAMNSNNPELMTEAATLVDRIDEIPGVVNQIPNTEQAYLKNVTNLMQNMEPEEAIDLAKKATDPKDRARIEVAEQGIKEAKKDTPGLFSEKSKEAFSGLFAFDPVIDDVNGARMAEEYGALWENLVKSGMSQSDAFEKSDKTIKRNWGETQALGVKRVMKYPPEQYYAIDNDTSWIKSGLMADIRDQVFGLDVKSEDVVLMSNDETARTATTGSPTYAVKVLIDGSFVNIGQWAPDMNLELERRKQQNIKEALEERKESIRKNFDIEKRNDVVIDQMFSGGLF